MLTPAIALPIGAAYLAGLFVIAYVSDRAAQRGRDGFISSPIVYTLSLAVYCTAWTFYGAVGSAVRNGLEFLTIYLGPTIIFLGWWLFLRKIVRICRDQQITSIADFLSARYGKSGAVSAIVTVMAITAITPYIALQMKAVATSFDALAYADSDFVIDRQGYGLLSDTGFWVAAIMAVFVILFGTRRLTSDESHPGVVAAIAFESIVKLFALMTIGLVVVFYLATSDLDFDHGALQSALNQVTAFPEGGTARWITITFIAGAAIICLPRQFQVAAVENRDEGHLFTAAWLFPLYLLLISLFVVPIALAGLALLPATANPDLYVLWVPIVLGHEELAVLAFIGGLSAGTSMVIVSSIALSTMISNHLAVPLLLNTRLARFMPGDLSRGILLVRRISIVAILALGYVYYRTAAGSDTLASIGLISFVGVAQFLPALIGAVFLAAGQPPGSAGRPLGRLRGLGLYAAAAELRGERARLRPSGRRGPVRHRGPQADRPSWRHGLGDPLVHAVFWSLLANTLAYVLVSIATRVTPIGQLQSAIFVDMFRRPATTGEPVLPRSARIEDLSYVAERVLGRARTRALFASQASDQGRPGRDPPARCPISSPASNASSRPASVPPRPG